MNDFAGLRQPQSIEWDSAAKRYGLVNYGSDNINVLFYVRPVQNPQKSRESGRPVYDNIDFIRMQQPGEASTVIERPATQDDQHRFPRQYTLFQQKKTQIPEGSPIDLLFPNNPATAENLKSWGVFTVEQCANLSAHALHNIGMGAQEWSNKAKAYLDQAQQGKNYHMLQQKLEETESELRITQRNFHELQVQFKALMQKLEGGPAASNSPPFIPGYDAQTERLNANHPSQEIAARRKRGRPPVVPKDEQNVNQEQSTEQDASY